MSNGQDAYMFHTLKIDEQMNFGSIFHILCFLVDVDLKMSNIGEFEKLRNFNQFRILTQMFYQHNNNEFGLT